MLSYLVAVAITTGIYTLLTLGLNLQYGYTGLINFGHVAFFAVGAYASALLSLSGFPVWVGFAAATLASAALAYPLGLLCLRLRADYLAIVTLSFAEIVRVVIVSEEWLTNGPRGLPGIPRPFSGLPREAAELAYLGLVAGTVLVAVLLIRHLARSPYGRLVQAIRDDEEAVRSLGKHPARVKRQILCLGSALAGIAGALYAHHVTFISPDQFLPIVTFYVWIAMIMGGAGTVAGPVLGAGILLAFLEGSRFLRDVVPVVSEVQMASLRIAAVGLALVLFMLYRPRGLITDKRQA